MDMRDCSKVCLHLMAPAGAGDITDKLLEFLLYK